MDESTTEPTTSELKEREAAAEYLRIQENTEVLSQVLRFDRKTKKNPLKFQGPIELRSFLNLVVQVSYLLYTCSLRKINLYISQEVYAMPPRRNEMGMVPIQEPYCVYLLQIEHPLLKEMDQEAFRREFRLVELTRSDSVYGAYLSEFILKIRGILKPHLERMRNMPEGMALFRQMEGLGVIVESFLLPQVRSLTPKAFIMCLEESELFRECSSLVKCLNNSLFAALRFHPNSNSIYAELLGIESSIIGRTRRDSAEAAARVEEILEESVKLLLRDNIIFSEASLNDSNIKQQGGGQGVGGGPGNEKFIIGSAEGMTVETRRYQVRIFINEKPMRPFSQEMLGKIEESLGKKGYLEVQPVKSKDEKVVGRSEYLIEYLAGKGVLSIKYITNIELNIENTDLLMFHCNYLSYSWNNVTLEFTERSSLNSRNKRKERFLAFRTVTYLNPNEHIAFKVLAMVDLLMVYAKLTEPHLRKNIFSMDEYYQRATTLNRHCEHMKRIFIEKVERNYQIIQEQQG